MLGCPLKVVSNIFYVLSEHLCSGTALECLARKSEWLEIPRVGRLIQFMEADNGSNLCKCELMRFP